MPARRVSGFRLISEGATIDGRAVAAGPVLRVQCSGGSAGSPADCFYFKQEGVLFVLADTPDYAVVVGNDDFSDAHNTIKLDHLNVNNRKYRFRRRRLPVQLRARQRFVGGLRIGRRRRRAGARADAVLADFRVPAPRKAPADAALVLENGFNFANTFFALDLEVSPICLSHHLRHMTDRIRSSRRISLARPRSTRRRARTIC